ncbi:hypothetical protein G6F31_018363 [Rhizopus arrhizus]|nr:hypothetical protein G6F31_018363 [Rhizopus arrhizus]
MGAKQKLVVVGNGMAGIRTVEELLALAPDLYDITVFGAEPHTNYNRILLSPVLTGERTLQDIVLNDEAWWTACAASCAPMTEPKRRMTGCCWRPARTRSSCLCRATTWTASSPSAISAMCSG